MYLQLTNWDGDHGICRKIETSRIIKDHVFIKRIAARTQFGLRKMTKINP